MKFKLKIALGIIVWLAIAGDSMAEANFTKLVKEIRPAVVTVIVYDANHQVTGLGSGFCAGGAGTFVEGGDAVVLFGGGSRGV